ncbi:MAG: hypothetical protein ABSG92_07725 [Conexivisphaerales archaeon]|jgi:hypothetical protein
MSEPNLGIAQGDASLGSQAHPDNQEPTLLARESAGNPLDLADEQGGKINTEAGSKLAVTKWMLFKEAKPTEEAAKPHAKWGISREVIAKSILLFRPLASAWQCALTYLTPHKTYITPSK